MADFEDFKAQVSATTSVDDVPLADEISMNIPIYDGATVRTAALDADKRKALLLEWAQVFLNGAGVLAIRGAMPDLSVVDRATQIFDELIEAERDAGGGGGDHFAKPGANDRVWNAVQKHCFADPENFADYYSSDVLALAAEAWLGPGYQVTAQVNRVNPGGAAQKPHRDYHLGFMTAEQISRYPQHIHQTSAQLTLQGAIAHVDMPIESGPTQLLPFSQIFKDGYRRFGDDEYQAHFAANFVQLPLNKGDMLFFNPALMHGAGDNTSADIYRMGNLLQVSSAFGRAMEAMDKTGMCSTVYPVLKDRLASNAMTRLAVSNVVASCADGYPFPTSLDTDPPVGGLAPETQAQRMLWALSKDIPVAEFQAQLAAYDEKRGP